MSGARVESIDALRALAGGLARFGVMGQQALGSGAMELRRMSDWLGQQLAVWQLRVRQGNEEVNRARSALSLQRSLSTDGRSGCTEAEITLRRAQQQVKEAEDKVQRVRYWQQQLPEPLREFETVAHRLGNVLEADLKMAHASLLARVAALAAYAELPPPPSPQGGTP